MISDRLFKSTLLNTDSYKVGMWQQYRPGTEFVYSYIESRGGRYDEIVMDGYRVFIQEYMSTPFTLEDIEEANKYWTAMGENFNKSGFIRMHEKYHGYWPVEIRAAPEGTVIPVKAPVLTIVNTDPEFPWATTWLETPMLRAIWFASTVATNSREIQKIILGYLQKDGNEASLPYKLHDFGARGASSFESSGIAALAHAKTGAKGSDTMTGNLFAMKYYGEALPILTSISATEHSTVTSWGRENENDAYRHMFQQFGKPGKIWACVSDSYNIYEAGHMWGRMAPEIIASGSILVVRPDSGDPLVVLPKLVHILETYFGSTVRNGYRLLNSVRVIWGDGITALTIDSILRLMVDVLGYSADNFAFGQGGNLQQNVTRDDQKWAMKCSAAFINGEWIDVFKDPITDPGKTSKKGLVTTYVDVEGIFSVGALDWRKDLLEAIYVQGPLEIKDTIADIQARCKLV